MSRYFDLARFRRGSRICALLAAVMPFSLSARTLVLSATGPSSKHFQQGTILNEPLQIKLVNGDILTVLDGAGTRVLRGPTQIRGESPRNVPAERQSTLAGLIADRHRMRAGAVRSTSGQAGVVETPAVSSYLVVAGYQLWQIDTAVGGDWCIPDLDAIELRRSDTAQSVEFSISPAAGSETTIRWPKGQASLYWPADVAPVDAGRYFVQAGSTQGRYVVLHLIKIQSDLIELARTFEGQQCYAQFDALTADEAPK